MKADLLKDLMESLLKDGELAKFTTELANHMRVLEDLSKDFGKKYIDNPIFFSLFIKALIGLAAQQQAAVQVAYGQDSTEEFAKNVLNEDATKYKTNILKTFEVGVKYWFDMMLEGAKEELGEEAYQKRKANMRAVVDTIMSEAKATSKPVDDFDFATMAKQ